MSQPRCAVRGFTPVAAPHARRRRPRPAGGEHPQPVRWRPVRLLPSEDSLGEQFGVSRTSVREAIRELITLGLIERRGNRAHVVEHLPEVKLSRRTSGATASARCSRPGDCSRCS